MRLYVVYLTLVLIAPGAYCQEKPSSIPDKVLADLSIAFDDGAAYFTSPLRMDGADAEHLVLFAGSTATFIGADKSAMHAAHAVDRSNTLNTIMDIGTGYADTKYAMILPTTLYVGGLFGGHDGIRTTGRQIFQALLYSTAITQSFKYLVGRSRPHVAGDPFHARPFTSSDDYFSMPSGHSTVAFAVSSVLAQNINNIYASIGLYGLAATTAISRIYLDRHWLSDVFVGAVIGTTAGIFVTTRDERSTSESQSSRIRITPGFSGIRFDYRF
jgi:membrane-associated phospholipid phosphatase